MTRVGFATRATFPTREAALDDLIEYGRYTLLLIRQELIHRRLA